MHIREHNLRSRQAHMIDLTEHTQSLGPFTVIERPLLEQPGHQRCGEGRTSSSGAPTRGTGTTLALKPNHRKEQSHEDHAISLRRRAARWLRARR